jgi:hypothetical protein
VEEEEIQIQKFLEIIHLILWACCNFSDRQNICGIDQIRTGEGSYLFRGLDPPQFG